MKAIGGIAAALTALVVLAAPAYGAATRAEYVAQADPICQNGQRQMKKIAIRNRPAIKRISSKLEREAEMLSDARETALLGRLSQLIFAPTRRIFPQVTTDLAALIPAPGDATAISGWLTSRRAYIDLVNRAVQAARRGKTIKETFLLEKAHGKLIEGELPVEGYGFRFCLGIVPSD